MTATVGHGAGRAAFTVIAVAARPRLADRGGP
jgi:hypothetical protein